MSLQGAVRGNPSEYDSCLDSFNAAVTVLRRLAADPAVPGAHELAYVQNANCNIDDLEECLVRFERGEINLCAASDGESGERVLTDDPVGASLCENEAHFQVSRKGEAATTHPARGSSVARLGVLVIVGELSIAAAVAGILAPLVLAQSTGQALDGGPNTKVERLAPGFDRQRISGSYLETFTVASWFDRRLVADRSHQTALDAVVSMGDGALPPASQGLAGTKSADAAAKEVRTPQVLEVHQTAPSPATAEASTEVPDPSAGPQRSSATPALSRPAEENARQTEMAETAATERDEDAAAMHRPTIPSVKINASDGHIEPASALPSPILQNSDGGETMRRAGLEKPAVAAPVPAEASGPSDPRKEDGDSPSGVSPSVVGSVPSWNDQAVEAVTVVSSPVSGQLDHLHSEEAQIVLDLPERAGSDTGTARIGETGFMEAEQGFPASPTSPAATAPAPTALFEQRLQARAEALLKNGDISGARLLLEWGVKAGSARGAFLLAQTYDPARLAQWHVVGIRGDHDRSRELYERAHAAGIKEAGDALTARRSRVPTPGTGR